MRRAIVAISTVFALGCIATLAFAYVLPGGYVLGKVADQRNTGGLAEFTIEGNATVSGPSGEISGEAQVRVAPSCCLEIELLAGKKEISLKIADGKVAGASPEMKALGDAVSGLERGLLLMFPGRAAAGELAAAVRALGIETETSSLARFFGRIAVVIGAPPRERAVPQLWIDKDAYHALRLMLPRKGAAKETIDVRFSDYQHSPMPAKLPRVIEIASGQAVLFRLEADRAASGAPQTD